MLGKLMKHEWHAVWKIPTLFIGVLLIVSLLTGSCFAFPMWESDWIGLPLSIVSLFMLYYMAIIVCSVGITVYLAVRFYKSMFTDEGYLTHTLPATSHQILLSKVFTMCIWNLLSILGVAVSIFLLVGSVTVFWADNFSQIGMEFRRLFHEVAESGMLNEVVRTMFTGVFMVIVSSFTGTMTVVGSICIGQMLRKHRILGAIGAYFGIMTVTQIVGTMVMFPMMFQMTFYSSFEEMFSSYLTMYWILTVICFGIGVGLYFLSEYLIRRQLYLE